MMNEETRSVVVDAVPVQWRSVEFRGAQVPAVEARIVPWGEVIEVPTMIDGRMVIYRETFARGAFEDAEIPANAGRVPFMFGHNDEFGNVMARGLSFRNEPDGEYGLFRLVGDPGRQALARDLLEDSAVSVSFSARTPPIKAGALITRSQVRLRHVAAVPEGAYSGASVVALRESQNAELAAERERVEREATMREAILTLQSADPDKLSDVHRRWLDEHPAPPPEDALPLPELPGNHAEALSANLSIGNDPRA